MSTLTERLVISSTETVKHAVEIKNNTNVYDTLYLYCANNDVKLSIVTNEDFTMAAMLLEDAQREESVVYFHIDEEI